jgi:phosphatidylserine/phosphatidylglycerophosphate/cardiolipin synthase-like enzyme
MKKRGIVILASVLTLFGVVLCAMRRPPDGVPFRGGPRPCSELRFLKDLTWTAPDGVRCIEQEIFDEIFRMIRDAKRLVLVDMFLFNRFEPDGSAAAIRPLCEELTDALVAKRLAAPDVQIIVITDPINTVYGGVESPHLRRLKEAGIPVVLTRLEKLRDSNLLYSCFWRTFIQWFGNRPAQTVQSPFGPERVSIRSWLALLNFKANHRKVVIADDTALVTSANPHDGSSAHGNIAVRFSGPAAVDLLESERSVLRFSGGPLPEICPADPVPVTALALQVLTEYAIKEAALDELSRCEKGDEVNLVMFYLSDRDLIRALKQTHARGATLRILLDPNRDAFGRKKNGVPNRPVAAELNKTGIAVRWADTSGEQSHAKLLLIRRANGEQTLIGGSANYTRRNLDNFNLETSVLVRGPADNPFFEDVSAYVDLLWNNEPGRRFSVNFESYKDHSLFKRALYRFMEWSGLSSF